MQLTWGKIMQVCLFNCIPFLWPQNDRIIGGGLWRTNEQSRDCSLTPQCGVLGERVDDCVEWDRCLKSGSIVKHSVDDASHHLDPI